MKANPENRVSEISVGQGEAIVRIDLADLYPYPDHPYALRDDQSMQDTVDSVKANGVVVPAIVRPRAEGGFEIISGHRRKRASELAGLSDMSCVVRNLSDDEAIIQLVDSNAQREEVLPSERAKAYKMRMDAIKRQGARTDITSPNYSARFRSDDEVGSVEGISGDTVRNFVSLNNLVPELMQMVDSHRISLTPAYHLAGLNEEEQRLLLETIESEQATPSVSQAQRMKRLSQSGDLNEDTILEIMSEQKKPENEDITLSGERLRKYFPKSYTPRKMEETIYKLLDEWQRKRQRKLER